MRMHIMSWSAALAAIALHASALVAASEEPLREHSITVVYNHEGSTEASGLLRRGGFSAYVRLGERSVLFDVGGEASVILENLQRVGVDLAELRQNRQAADERTAESCPGTG